MHCRFISNFTHCYTFPTLLLLWRFPIMCVVKMGWVVGETHLTTIQAIGMTNNNNKLNFLYNIVVIVEYPSYLYDRKKKVNVTLPWRLWLKPIMCQPNEYMAMLRKISPKVHQHSHESTMENIWLAVTREQQHPNFCFTNDCFLEYAKSPFTKIW